MQAAQDDETTAGICLPACDCTAPIKFGDALVPGNDVVVAGEVGGGAVPDKMLQIITVRRRGGGTRRGRAVYGRPSTESTCRDTGCSCGQQIGS
jgi:hypothetical protein